VFKGRLHIGILAGALVFAAAILGYAGWSAHQKRVHRQAVTAVVEDTTARLRDSLTGTLELKKIEAHAAAVDAHLPVLKSNAAKNRDLADAAELYVISAREIFKRQAAVMRFSEHASLARKDLELHIGKASRRDRGWIDEAMSRKKKVEAQYFDYNLSLTGLSELLYRFPDSRKPLAPLVHESVLLEPGLAETAWRRSQAEAKRAADDLAVVRRLN